MNKIDAVKLLRDPFQALVSIGCETLIFSKCKLNVLHDEDLLQLCTIKYEVSKNECLFACGDFFPVLLNFGPELLNELLHVVLAGSDEYLELLVLVDVINVDDFNLGILGFLALVELYRETNHIEGFVFGRRVTALLADYLLFHQTSKQLAYQIFWLLIEILL